MKKLIYVFGIGFILSGSVYAQQTKKAKLSAEDLISKFDANEDGLISKDEVKNQKRVTEHFEKIDENNDNLLSEAEINKMLEKRENFRKNKSKFSDAKKINLRQRLAKLDVNNDKFISKQEAAQAKNKRLVKNFEKVDKDQDGLISAEELKLHLKKVRVRKS